MRNAGNAYSIFSKDKNKHIRKEDFHGNSKPIYASMNQHVPDLPDSGVQSLSAGAAEGQPTNSYP